MVGNKGGRQTYGNWRPDEDRPLHDSRPDDHRGVLGLDLTRRTSLLVTVHAANPEVVYIAGVWDLDNTPRAFLRQGKATGAAIQVEIVNRK